MANDYAGTSDLAGAVGAYYNKKFLERMVNATPAMDYCTKRPVPLHEGNVVYFARMANSSTTPSAYRIQYSAGREPISLENVTSVAVSATVEKYGNAKGIQDATQLMAINSVVEETSEEQGDQAGNIVDKRILQEAYGTSATPTGAGFSCFFHNGVSDTNLGASTSAGPIYAGTVEYDMNAVILRAAAAKLIARNVKPFENGYYALLCHTNTAFRLKADTSWQSAYKNTDPGVIRKGGFGEKAAYEGVMPIIDNNVWTSANGSVGDTLYYSVLLGRGALSVSEINGGTTFKTTSGADKYDPLDEFTTVGWKTLFAVARTNVSAGLIVVTADGN